MGSIPRLFPASCSRLPFVPAGATHPRPADASLADLLFETIPPRVMSDLAAMSLQPVSPRPAISASSPAQPEHQDGEQTDESGDRCRQNPDRGKHLPPRPRVLPQQLERNEHQFGQPDRAETEVERGRHAEALSSARPKRRGRPLRHGFIVPLPSRTAAWRRADFAWSVDEGRNHSDAHAGWFFGKPGRRGGVSERFVVAHGVTYATALSDGSTPSCVEAGSGP